MAKVLLRIGYCDILLPSDAGVATLMKVISKGISVNRVYEGDSRRGCRIYQEVDRDVDVSMELLSDKTIVRMLKPAKELARHAGPNADGRDITKRGE